MRRNVKRVLMEGFFTICDMSKVMQDIEKNISLNLDDVNSIKKYLSFLNEYLVSFWIYHDSGNNSGNNDDVHMYNELWKKYHLLSLNVQYNEAKDDIYKNVIKKEILKDHGFGA